jgi:hypothetical protein
MNGLLQRLWTVQRRAAAKALRVVDLAVAAALLIALLVGGAYAMAGLALALLVVAGVAVTLGSLPGFWLFATSRVGYPLVILLTGLVAHQAFGATSLVGVFAIGWALVVKNFVLRAARARVRDGRNASPFAAAREAQAAADVNAREAAGLVHVVPG